MSKYVNFGDIVRSKLFIQCQYAIQYIDRRFTDVPNLDEGLRFIGNLDDYHNVRIHRDDVNEFVKRFKCSRLSNEN